MNRLQVAFNAAMFVTASAAVTAGVIQHDELQKAKSTLEQKQEAETRAIAEVKKIEADVRQLRVKVQETTLAITVDRCVTIEKTKRALYERNWGNTEVEHALACNNMQTVIADIESAKQSCDQAKELLEKSPNQPASTQESVNRNIKIANDINNAYEENCKNKK